MKRKTGSRKTSTYTKSLIRLERMISEREDVKNTDTHVFLTSPRRAIWANIMIGVSRGVGFVIGVSIIGAIVITLLGALLSNFVSIPIIGEFIATIVKSVQSYLGNRAY